MTLGTRQSHSRAGRGPDPELTKLLGKAYDTTGAYAAKQRKALAMLERHERMRERLDRADEKLRSAIAQRGEEYQGAIKQLAADLYGVRDRIAPDMEFDFVAGLTLRIPAVDAIIGVRFADDRSPSLPRRGPGKADSHRRFFFTGAHDCGHYLLGMLKGTG